MSRPPVLVLYGLDETSQDFEISSTRELIDQVRHALAERGWDVTCAEVTHDLEGVLAQYPPQKYVVLNLCEGSPHQAFYYARAARVMEERGYTFTGSDWRVLDETQFKWRMKEMFARGNVPTPAWALCDGECSQFNQFPAIVKPASEHCSYGITRESVALNADEMRKQVARVAQQFKAPALVEAFLDSPEYNISLWGNDGGVSVMAVSTMTYDAFDDIHDRLCTFDAKWTPDSSAYRLIPAICPAPLTDALRQKIERVSIAAYKACGCRDYGRVDLRLDAHGEPLVFDVNANCGIAPDDGFANAAKAMGLSYGEMLERLLLMALERKPLAAPSPKICVRDCAPADRSAITHILLNSGIFGQVDADTVDEMFTQTFAKPITRESYHFLMAESAGQTAGFACYGTESLTHNTWDLFWVCALPAMRGMGVGRALMQRAVDGARAEQGRLMVIYTSSTQAYAPARKLYASMGFERTATIPDYYDDGDSLFIYSKRLGANRA
jgi:D-alanine-D-alanine ligase